MGPLSGVRVIEMIGLGPCPFAGMMLADMGAEVIAIERPGGGTLDMSPDFFRRGKTIRQINVKSDAGRAEVANLIGDADALIEGFRPGVMERLGLGPDDCARSNPRLVYGRMTGWGQEGPLAQAAGHDLNYIALAGALYPMGPGDGPPQVPLNLIGDFGGGGMFLAFGMVCALFEARQSGQGQVVDAAMIDGASILMTMFHAFRVNGLWSDTRGQNWLDGAAHFYGAYETADGKFITLGALEPQFMQVFLDIMGLPADWMESHDQPADWPAKKAELAALFRTKTQWEWCELLEGSDACFAPVLPFWDAHTHPHIAARSGFVEHDGWRQPAPAPRFSRTKPRLK